MNSMFAADPKDRHDVWVVQLGGGLSLDLKSLTLLRVDRRGEWKHLQGNSAA